MSFNVYDTICDSCTPNNSGNLEGSTGPTGPIGPTGPPGLSNGENHINVLANNAETQVNTGQNIVFDSGILVDFEYTGQGYKFTGSQRDIIVVAVNIQYRSLSTLPYEIVSFVLKINNIPKFIRKYGFDMQERIKDEFLIDLHPNDLLEFVLEGLHNSNSPAAAIETKSFITLKSLRLFQELDTTLILPPSSP